MDDAVAGRLTKVLLPSSLSAGQLSCQVSKLYHPLNCDNTFSFFPPQFTRQTWKLPNKSQQNKVADLTVHPVIRVRLWCRDNFNAELIGV